MEGLGYSKMVEELNEDLEALTEWLKNNKLKLNSTKLQHHKLKNNK
jgi:hypothetical protein